MFSKRENLPVKRKEVRFSDLLFYNSLRGLAFVVIALFITIFIFLFTSAEPTFASRGWAFFTETKWSPTKDIYSVSAFVYGTVVSSFLALIFAVPISVGSALFLTQICPKFLRRPIRTLIELLAAIPSVVYGLWGIFVLAPFIKNYVQPFLSEHTESLPFFQGPPFGLGLFTAGIILAIMIIPTITTISIEVFSSIPKLYQEGAKALGATDWEAMRMAVLAPGFSGVFAAVILGLGRAMGETMAVTMVIGNRADISSSLFSPAATMASVIANEYAEASSQLHSASLAAVGFTLLLISMIVNFVARLIIKRARKNA